MKLYHGTTARHLENIQDRGLVPRYKKRGNWSKTVKSNPRAVYLTPGYGIHFAEAACRSKKDDLLICEVDTDHLVDAFLAPDEDFLEQITRNDPSFATVPGTEPWDMKKRTMWFRQRALEQWQHMWQASVEHGGTAAYYGDIPPFAITRYAIIPRSCQHIRFASDPVPGPRNWQFMGGYYKALTKHVFGDEVADDEVGNPTMKTVHQLPRDGIRILEPANDKRIADESDQVGESSYAA